MCVIKHPGHTYRGFGSVLFLEPGYDSYEPTRLKGISPMRFRKCSAIIWGNLLWALLHAPMLLHLPFGDSTILCTCWLPYCESLILRYPRSWLVFHCRSNHLQGQDIPLVVAPLALVTTSSAVICETHHALLATVVAARVDMPLLLCGQ
jgi:hypothetical protein